MRTRLSLLLLLPMLLASAVVRGQSARGAGGAAPVVSSKEAVQQVVQKYARAIETEDVELFRAVMPGLNGQSERRLRRAFDTVKVQQIGLTIRSIEIDGATATVRARGATSSTVGT